MTKMPTQEEVEEFGADDMTTPNELRWWRRGLMRGTFHGVCLGIAIMNIVHLIFNQIYGH